MIDLNHILLFIAVVSPLILLVRIARLRNARNHGWRIAAILVLGGCVAAWFVVPASAGFIGGILWSFLLLAPSLADRKIEDLYLMRRFAEARRLAVVRQSLHPWKDSPYRPRIFQILEQASAGRLDLALDQLAIEREETTPAGRFAAALTFALTENWPGLVQWCRRDLSVIANPAVLPLYFRALGETGDLEDLVLLLASRAASREPRLTIDRPWFANLALVLAFAGKTGALARLFDLELRDAPPAEKQFWLATAELAVGEREAGLARLRQQQPEVRDILLRRSIDHRLAQSPSGVLSATGGRLLGRVTASSFGAREAAPRHRLTGTPAVWALILLNLAMFVVELMMGGSTNSLTLQNLGGLEPAAVVVRHEYWRLFTALFLHYGILHVGINLLGLYILGPALERTIGAIKFVLCYLLSGLGSSAVVVTLWWLGLTNSNLLVGASGSIMGVIGVSAGLLLRHRQSPFAGRQLKNIIAIVAIQTVFDLWSPQVSLAAHLGGFVSGFVIGVGLASQGAERLPRASLRHNDA
ncbi:MAG: rhomboid family intramembrane serine protease [Chthoniobacterales bacterium]